MKTGPCHTLDARKTEKWHTRFFIENDVRILCASHRYVMSMGRLIFHFACRSPKRPKYFAPHPKSQNVTISALSPGKKPSSSSFAAARPLPPLPPLSTHSGRPALPSLSTSPAPPRQTSVPSSHLHHRPFPSLAIAPVPARSTTELSSLLPEPWIFLCSSRLAA